MNSDEKEIQDPLPEAPFRQDVLRLLEHFAFNFNINGTGAVIASPGDTPALPDSCVGGYRYHWPLFEANSLQP